MRLIAPLGDRHRTDDPAAHLAAAPGVPLGQQARLELLAQLAARLPVPVIVEAAQLSCKRLGVAAEAALTESIAREQQFTITCPTEEELARAAVLMRQCADLRLGLVDATVIALAEHVGTTQIATWTGGTSQPAVAASGAKVGQTR